MNLRRYGYGLGAMFLPVLAMAAAIDVDAVTTDIAAQAAPVAAIGAAVLLLIVGIKAFKWVRRALSILLPVGGAALMAAPQTSEAAAIVVTAVTADIAAQATPVAAIGAAVLLLIVGIKAFKWVRRAL